MLKKLISAGITHSKLVITPFSGERKDFDRLSKVVGYYSVGYVKEAAKLGFSVYESRGSHPKLVFYGHHG